MNLVKANESHRKSGICELWEIQAKRGSIHASSRKRIWSEGTLLTGGWTEQDHGAWVAAVLTPLVLLVHGYHPLADDGGIYVAGIQKLVDPTMFATDSMFALLPTRVSVFAHVVAAIVRWGHAPLLAVLLFCQLTSIFLFLLGSWKVAAHLFTDSASRCGAVLLAACCFTLPVAGTSLCIMDPYVTARSFSTPLSLFALAAVLEKRWAACVLWLLLAALVHPLMTIYAAMAVAAVALAKATQWRTLAFFLSCVWGLSAVCFLRSHQSGGSTADLAVLSRSYFFLSNWRWYEYFGLLLPLLLLGMTRRAVARAAMLLCGCALLVSLCFVHRSGSLFLARLQVLRTFQFLYLVGVLLAGGWLGGLAAKSPRRIAAAYLCIALALFAGQRLTFPASPHLEWPGQLPRNDWQRGFAWIRTNTPREAVFALDNDYIESAGEDAQSFRATAERSAVADYFKDGGIASNFPQAAPAWWQGSNATAQLNRANDRQRWVRLHPLGVQWIVLPTAAKTEYACPYVNGSVRVCRLNPLLHNAEGAK